MSSTDWYFYQEQGKTVGPIRLDEVKARIHDGRIRLFSLLYKEGDKGWRMALEHTDLRAEFSSAKLQSLKLSPWVCLKRKSPEVMDFITIGPFNEEQVRERLLSGELSYSDYIWKDGFTKWKRIGGLKEFNPRVKAEVPSPREPSAAELVQNVARLEKRVEVESKPPEAVTENLAEPVGLKPEPPAPPKKPRKQKAKVKSPPPTAPAEEALEKPRAGWMDWTLFAGLALMLGISVWFMSRRIARPVPVPVAKPSKMTTIKPSMHPKTVAQPKASVPPAEPPKFLRLQAKAVGQHHVQITIESDASKRYPVEIQIIGLPGQVSDGAFYYHYLRFDPSRGKPLNLGTLKMPEGEFEIRARAGDLKKQVSLHLGPHNKTFHAAIHQARKDNAYVIWRERLRLFALSSRVMTNLSHARPGQGLSLRGLTELRRIHWRTGQYYALFDKWYDLAQLVKEAHKQVTPELVARARRLQSEIAGFSVWK